MLRRTLTVLTSALFALPFLLTPTSQVYADADMMNSVYSGLECKYLMSWAMEGQAMMGDPDMMGDPMMGGDVVYHSQLGIGNRAPRSRNEANPDMPDPDGNTRDYKMSIACPLPSLEMDTEVRVAVIDGTVFDDVTCWIQTCRAGIGLGSNGQGGCEGDYMSGKSTNYADQPPYTQPEKYITQNVDWLNLTAPADPGTGSGAGREVPETELGEPYSHLLCTIPERDDRSPEAPVVDGEEMQGISYIQSYYVMDMN